MKKFDAFYAKFNEWLVFYICGTLVMVSIFYVSANVIGRYLFNQPTPGMNELVGAALVPITYLTMAYGWRKKGTFITIEIVMMKLKGRLRWAMELLIQLIALGLFCGPLVYAAMLETIHSYQMKGSVGTLAFLVTEWPFIATIAAGTFLMIIGVFLGLIRHFRGEPWQQSASGA